MAFVRPGSAIVIIAATAALNACGGDSPDYVSSAPIVNAAQKTAAAGSAKAAVDVAWTESNGRHVELTGDGVVDIAGREGRLALDLSGVPGARGTVEQIFDGSVVWMHIPGFALPRGKKWIRIDVDKASKDVGGDVGSFPQAASDPASALGSMRSATQVEDEGGDEVRGVPTTHYSARVTEETENLVDLLGHSQLASEVWVDHGGMIRRTLLKMPLQIPGSGLVDMEFDYELYDFGVNVDVAPPPAEQVIEASELQKQRR